MKRSNYDDIHDEYWNSDIRKSGTRYERLTAFVFKSLQKENTVIHDIKLRGDSDVKHQIDVTIGINSMKKRVLIECKDFDISGKKVGLGIVRDFWGVVDDVYPDEAIVITCNGFTRGARKYAKSKRIKLVVLREVRDFDLAGRIQTVAVTLHVLTITDQDVQMYFSDQSQLDKLSQDLSAAGIGDIGVWKGMPVYLNLENERVQFNEYVQSISNAHPRDTQGPVEIKMNMKGRSIEVEKRGPITMEGFVVHFEVVHGKEYLEITSNKVAKLILIDLAGSDLIIFEENLKFMKINEESGEIFV